MDVADDDAYLAEIEDRVPECVYQRALWRGLWPGVCRAHDLSAFSRRSDLPKF
jgi:hypothetical protein